MLAVRQRFEKALFTLRRARFGGGRRRPRRLEGEAQRPLSLRAAVVPDHRRARLRQDHGAAPLGPQVPARRRRRRRRDPRRRRHAQLRLVVHRPGRPDRHRRPLHHTGQRPRERPLDLERLPGDAQAHAAAPAAQRRAGHGLGVRPADAARSPSGASTRPPCASACRSCTRASASASRSTCWSPRPICSPASPTTSRPSTRSSARRPGAATFPVKANSAQNLQRFGHEFDALVQRLEDGLVERLQPERDAQKRARIYGFAGQFAGIARRPAGVPRGHSRRRRTRPKPCCAASTSSAARRKARRSIACSARSRAATDSSARSSRRTRRAAAATSCRVCWARWCSPRAAWPAPTSNGSGAAPALAVAGYAAIALVTVGALAAWRRQLRSTTGATSTRSRQRVGTRFASWCRARPTAPRPTCCRSCPRSQRRAASPAPSDRSPVEARLSACTRAPSSTAPRAAAYQRMLVDAMLPRIGLRVEEQLRQASNATETQYEALKTYLMLHDAEHFDAEALKSYVAADWDSQFGRSLTAEERDAARQAPERAARARGRPCRRSPRTRRWSSTSARGWPRCRCRSASTTACASRASARTSRSSRSSAPPATTPRWCSRGPAAQPLTKGVPGLFTYDGYHKGFQKEVEQRRPAARRGADLGPRRRPSRQKDAAQRSAAASRCSTRCGASTSTSTPRAGRRSSPTSASCR